MKFVVWCVFLLCFCIACEPILTDKPGVVDIPDVNSAAVDNKTNLIKIPPNSSLNTLTLEEIEKNLDKVIWITPGKVNIGNLFPGAQAEWNLRIHNDRNESVSFAVVNRSPDYTEKGYISLPYKWMTIETDVDGLITIAPRSVRSVPVVVKFDPRDKPYFKKYETWISVMDTSQTGMIKTELCSRWFIDIQ